VLLLFRPTWQPCSGLQPPFQQYKKRNFTRVPPGTALSNATANSSWDGPSAATSIAGGGKAGLWHTGFFHDWWEEFRLVLGTLLLVLGPTKQAACSSTVHGGAGSSVRPLAWAAPIFLSLARDGRCWE